MKVGKNLGYIIGCSYALNYSEIEELKITLLIMADGSQEPERNKTVTEKQAEELQGEGFPSAETNQFSFP